MRITLRFFASVRESVGTNHEVLEVAPEIASVGALRELLAARGGAWQQALAETHNLRMACNQQMCGAETALAEGCEVAFFPPVTGG